MQAQGNVRVENTIGSSTFCPALFFVSFSFVARRGKIFVLITQEKFKKLFPFNFSSETIILDFQDQNVAMGDRRRYGRPSLPMFIKRNWQV